MKICLEKMPPVTNITEGHSASCWLLQKIEFKNDEKTADNGGNKDA